MLLMSGCCLVAHGPSLLFGHCLAAAAAAALLSLVLLLLLLLMRKAQMRCVTTHHRSFRGQEAPELKGRKEQGWY